MARRKPIVLTIAAIILLIVIAASFFFFRKSSVSPAENTSAVPHARIEVESTDPFKEAVVTQSADVSTEELQLSFSVDDLSCNADVPTTEPEHNTQPQYRIIHHEAEYKTVHHDAVIIRHDAEYKTIHHKEEGYYAITPSFLSKASFTASISFRAVSGEQLIP